MGGIPPDPVKNKRDWDEYWEDPDSLTDLKEDEIDWEKSIESSRARERKRRAELITLIQVLPPA